mmetsp:Transcript_61547/g.170650  ORF Transcript_61547/g.170650 Transcript_61547/m.170650 type:complete len:346 (-) Transcript_61547:42-1079(-)
MSLPCAWLLVSATPRCWGWLCWAGHPGLHAQVLDLLPNGTIPIPHGIRRIFLEVGTNSIDTLDEDELPLFPDAFVVAFEPVLHQYASLLSRGARHSQLRRLGEHHEHGLLLPFAITPGGNSVELRIGGKDDSCASVLLPSGRRGPRDCANPNLPQEVRTVPAVSLRTVLGSWLAWQSGGGWPIDYLKIDAQGFDVEVLRSAGELLPRIRRVLLEVPADECEPLYVGSMHCSEIVAALAGLGYAAAYNRSCAQFLGVCMEDDWEFVRPGVDPLHDGILPHGDECWESTHVKPHELPSAKYLCCTGDLYLTTKFHGCWSSLFRRDRCCAKWWRKEYHWHQTRQQTPP